MESNPVHNGYSSLDPLDPSIQPIADDPQNGDILSQEASKGCCRRCKCCDNGRHCDNCIIKFARFWLGCGTSQFGYSVIVWYIINLGLDIYSFATASTRLFYVLYTFSIFTVDVPVLFFALRDQQYKLVFPFCCQIAMGFISVLYFIDKEVDPELVGVGAWSLMINALFDFLGSLSLIPLMTHRVPLWDQTDIGYSRLYPYSSKYDREIAIV